MSRLVSCPPSQDGEAKSTKLKQDGHRLSPSGGECYQLIDYKYKHNAMQRSARRGGAMRCDTMHTLQRAGDTMPPAQTCVI